MIEVRLAKPLIDWLDNLKDFTTKKRIAARIGRLSYGLFGDAKPVGDGVSELRLDFGPGYRVYFVRRGDALVILLCGGDKGSQQRDIETAKRMAKELED